MLKDVGMVVPETMVANMPQDKGLWHTTIIPCVTHIKKRCRRGLRIVLLLYAIIFYLVALLYTLIFVMCINTTLFSLILGTAIPTSLGDNVLHMFYWFSLHHKV